MLTLRAFVALVILAVLATYGAEYYGYMIVHSVFALVLVALTTPGFYVAFFDLIPNDLATYMLAFMVNLAYYYVLALLIRRRSKLKSVSQ